MEDAHLTVSSPWLASTKTSLFRNPRGSLLREQELKVKMFDRFLRQKEVLKWFGVDQEQPGPLRSTLHKKPPSLAAFCERRGWGRSGAQWRVKR